MCDRSEASLNVVSASLISIFSISITVMAVKILRQFDSQDFAALIYTPASLDWAVRKKGTNSKPACWKPHEPVAGRISALSAAVVLLKMMSQKIPYVNLWVTASLHSLFLARLYFRNKTHKRTYSDSLSSRDLFSNIHQCDAHITHAWIHLHWDTHLSAEYLSSCGAFDIIDDIQVLGML